MAILVIFGACIYFDEFSDTLTGVAARAQLQAPITATDLQSTDAGAALTKELYDLGLVDKREETIIAAWQYSGAGMINNYFAIASALFGFMACPILIPLAIIFVMKFIGAIICRFALDTIYKGDFKHGK